ncbi:MAG: hypothetical protein ABEK01_02740 [Candidatus Nanohaloarchaea archaeon]
MIAGLVLKDDVEKDSQLAFLGDELESVQASTNEEIIEEIEERKPEVLAIDAGETGRDEFSKQEEELKEEGYTFSPASHNKMKARRFEALTEQLFQMLGEQKPEVIRFEPAITSEELAIDGDEALESYGIDAENIMSAQAFDAVLGAVTARFYSQGQFEDLGVIVPEPLGETDGE